MLNLKEEMFCKAHTLRYTEEVGITMFLREMDTDDFNLD
jgi:hypothetical protein